MDSASVIGWLPAQTLGKEDEAGLNDFQENGELSPTTTRFLAATDPRVSIFICPSLIAILVARFREVLHQAIRDGLEEGCDDVQINGALQIREGWMHIHGKFSVALD